VGPVSPAADPERKRKLAPLSREAAERLSQLIERTGLSGRQFAAEIGLHDEDLNLLVNGKRTATGEKLLAIRDGLNRLVPGLRITVDELLEPRDNHLSVPDPGASPGEAAGSGAPYSRPTQPGGMSGATEILESAGGIGDTPERTRPIVGDDQALPPVVWYRVYLWGMRVDPRRLSDVPGGSYVRRPVAVGEETERVGAKGFGLLLNDASLSYWEGAEGQPLGRGWVLWCNPETRSGVQDGDLVVATDPARGLVAGVYRESDDGVFVETDDAAAQKQERRRIKPQDVVGPVVMASLLSSVPRRRERRAAGGDSSG
jgi:hypothetical protein